MAALLVAALLLGLLAAGGGAVVPRGGARSPDLALGAVVALAVWLVAVTDLSAVWGFGPGTAALTAVVVGVAAWLASRRRGSAGRRAGAGAERRLMLLVGMALAAPLLLLPVPLDTDAQGFGQLALAVREGGGLTTLAPFRPGIAYLYAPGGPVLFASLSALLPGIPMSAVMLGAAHAIALLFVALSGSLGEELGELLRSAPSGRADQWPEPATWRRAAQLGAAASPGLWTALLDAHYTAVLGLTVGMGAVVAMARAWRAPSPRAAAVAGATLAALAVAHQDSALAVALGLVPLSVAALLAAPAGERAARAAVTAAAAALAAVLLLPWLAEIAPLLATGIASPFVTDPAHWRQMVLYHGGLWPVLAAVGLVVVLRRQPAWGAAIAVWMVLLVDLSLLGLLDRAAGSWTAPLHRFSYPFSLAWHGPLLPFLALGTVAVASALGTRGWRLERVPGRKATVAAAAAIVAVAVAAPRAAAAVAGRAPFYGALASANDVEAMGWLRRHAPPGDRVLNYPGDLPGLRDWEGHWAPVVTERDCVYFRMQPFFLDDPRVPATAALADAVREQREMLAFWRDPADPANGPRLAASEIAWVLVPEAVGDPGSLARAWRGRPPALLDGRRPPPLDPGLLRPVFRAGGAAVYEVRGRRPAGSER